MFKDKNALISLAVAVVLAGCGGGGGDGGTPATASTTTTTTTTTSTPTPVVETPQVVVDESLMAGFFALASNELIFNATRITTDQFANASATPKGAYGFEGLNGPVQVFGFRLRPEGMNVDAGQSKTARLALELKDRASGGLQTLQLMIDKVDIAVSATSQVTVSIPATAKLYVYAKNSADQSATVTAINLPADLVKLSAIDGDTTSHGVTLDVDAAIAAAMNAAQGDTAKLAVVNSIKDFAGEFDMSVTLSNVAMQKTDATPLVGTAITVTGSGQPAVAGAGVKGILTAQ